MYMNTGGPEKSWHNQDAETLSKKASVSAAKGSAESLDWKGPKLEGNIQDFGPLHEEHGATTEWF